MLTNNAYTYDPIKFNNLNQAQLIYVGVDSLDSPTLAKGKIIVALSGPEKWMIGSYYTDYEELLKNDLDSVKLCQGVQVVPFFDKNVMLLPQYKTNARLYVLNEDINAAVGDTTENSHFGPGGLQQYAIPNGREMINAANEDKELYNPKHSIIPIDFNTFQTDPRLSEEIKKELQQIKASVTGNISPKDGSIELKNKEISREAYDLIKTRTSIHIMTAKYNCLMKEYTDELQKNDWNLENMKVLKRDVDEVYNDLDYLKFKFTQKCNEFQKNPELLKEFTKEQQEHLLNVDTCCSQKTYEFKNYLEKKTAYWEGKLEASEKQQLGISSENKAIDHDENSKVEKSLNKMYENYSAVDPHGIVNRKLIFAPKHLAQEQLLLKEKLFYCLKSKDDLITLSSKTKDEKVRRYCSQQINQIDKQINKYQDAVNASAELIGELESTLYDHKIEYLLNKTQLTTIESGEKFRGITVNTEAESNIEEMYKDSMKKFESGLTDPIDKYADMQKINDIGKFYDLSQEIEKFEKISAVIDNNVKKIKYIDDELQKREKVLTKAKENLSKADQYKDIANKYENKRILKKSYQKKHEYEKSLYDRALVDLKSSGITNWQQYHSEKANFEKLKPVLENNKRIIQSSTPDKMELFKKLTPLKNQQLHIIKDTGEIDKTKVISRKISAGQVR